MMQNEILNELNEVVEDHIRKISALSDGSEEKKKVIGELKTIHQLKIEEAKVIQADTQLRIEEAKAELADTQLKIEKAKVEQARWNQILTTGERVALAIGGWLFYKSVLKDEHYFEINNTPRTLTFKNLLSRVFPKF